ncbi:glucose dehydrogenase [FAD, quinone]-like [Aphidius gifuensis]|uniref:glucose dehydrogenase [FAD, quinone]-like n=1 Tax=Aphidius gifuensis TaxID=684658 RepID=UPI001CDCE314|nr:glucose dehydrogenase [FAD, quinone]-like [Aphidius gifuensis]
MECNCPLTVPPGETLAGICAGSQILFFMALLDSLFYDKCDISDRCRLFKPRSYFNSFYDFVVVGGGTAGSTVAGRLAELDATVLVIEAGPEEPPVCQVPALYSDLPHTELDWQYQTEPQKLACLNNENQSCYWPRGKVLGGCSAINGMVYIRGSKQDYDDWANMGNPGWSFKEVLPYFMRSENNAQADILDQGYHGRSGPLPISFFLSQPSIGYDLVRAGKELGYGETDFNGRNNTGFAFAQGIVKDGHRVSLSRAFLRPQLNNPNLHVMLESTATKIIFDSQKRATGVKFVYKGKEYQVDAKKEVIVSAGSINTPNLLLHSGVGPTKELSSFGLPTVHNLPGVGANLQDHVSYALTVTLNVTEETMYNFGTASEYISYGTGPFSQSGLNQVDALINTKYANPNDNNPDIQIIFGGFEAECDKISEVREKTKNKISFAILPTLLRPKSRGSIRLRNNDPLSKPLLNPNYFSEPDDVDVLVEGIKFSVKIVETEALKKFGATYDKTPVKGCESFEFGSDPYWRCAVRRDTVPMYHQSSSCRMGPSTDPYNVVDSKLCVHGLEGLRIADTSIMPSIVSGNTMAAAIMIGEKAADFIKAKYAL